MPYKHREDLYAAQKPHRLKVRKMLFQYLSVRKCLDCGENDPIVLEFDHNDRGTKFKQISQMLSGHYSWKSVLEEIGKCEVRCANCHRWKSYIQLGHFGRTRPS